MHVWGLSHTDRGLIRMLVCRRYGVVYKHRRACEEEGQSLCQRTLTRSSFRSLAPCPYSYNTPFPFVTLLHLPTYEALEDGLEVTLNTFQSFESGVDVCVSMYYCCRGRGGIEHALFLLLH